MPFLSTSMDDIAAVPTAALTVRRAARRTGRQALTRDPLGEYTLEDAADLIVHPLLDVKLTTTQECQDRV